MWSVLSGVNETMRMFDAFDRQLADAFGDRRLDQVRPALIDKGEELLFTADVPGVKREDVDITIEGDVLFVRATRKPAQLEGFKPGRAERGALELSRKMTLPYRIDAEAVRADLTDGVLTVTLPKASDAKPRRIPVNVAS